MRYRLDSSMEFKHSGNILNCASSGLLNPLNFIITSRMTNIKSGEMHTVNVQKDDEVIQFSLPPDALDAGHYEWRVYLRNQMVSWCTSNVIVEVS